MIERGPQLRGETRTSPPPDRRPGGQWVCEAQDGDELHTQYRHNLLPFSNLWSDAARWAVPPFDALAVNIRSESVFHWHRPYGSSHGVMMK